MQSELGVMSHQSEAESYALSAVDVQIRTPCSLSCRPTRPPGDMGSSTGPVGCVVLRLDGFPSTELGGLRVGAGGTQLALVS